MSTIVFLGGGRITSAMLAGLRLGKSRHRLVVHDRNPGKLRDLKKRYAVAVEPDLLNAVQQADMLIVAVRPSSVRELLGMVGKVNRQIARGQSGRRHSAACAEPGGRPAHAMGPCHAKSGLPQWARLNGGGLSPEFAACGSQTRPGFFLELRPCRRNPGKQVQCVHRDLLMQPRLSRARDSGARWARGRS